MIRVLRGKSGAALIFVVAVTFMLLALGVSLFTAAGLGFGAAMVRRDRNQLELYSGSMDRTIRGAMEAPQGLGDFGEGIDVHDVDTLAGLVVLEVFKEVYPGRASGVRQHIAESGAGGFRFTTGDVGGAGPTIVLPNVEGVSGALIADNVQYDVEISWSMNTAIQYEPYICLDGDYEIDVCVLTELTIIGDIYVTLTTSYYPDPLRPPLVMSTGTTYRLDRVDIREEECQYPLQDCVRESPEGGTMLIIDMQVPRFISHETI